MQNRPLKMQFLLSSGKALKIGSLLLQMTHIHRHVCAYKLHRIRLLYRLADTGYERRSFPDARSRDTVLHNTAYLSLPACSEREVSRSGISHIHDKLRGVPLCCGVFPQCGYKLSFSQCPHLGAYSIDYRHKYLCGNKI